MVKDCSREKLEVSHELKCFIHLQVLLSFCSLYFRFDQSVGSLLTLFIPHFPPLLSALLFFTHALVFSFWELRAVLWISNSAGHHGVIDGLWQGPTQSNICSKWKKRNRIKQGSQVAKEKHAKHVWKQRFFEGGWGLVHDDTISWISPVLKYEHKVWTKERKETIYPTGIMWMIMVRKYWVQITLN